MEDHEKAFIDYCKGYKWKEIASKRGTTIGTVKSWSQRGIKGVKWTILKAECTDPDTGDIDLVKAASFVSGKGNVIPVMAGKNKPPQCYPDKLQQDKALISQTLQSVLSTSNYNKPCKTDEEVIIRIDNYFNMCIEYGIIPTVEGIANCLYVDVDTILTWQKSGTVRGAAVKNAKQRIQDFDAKLSMQGKVNPATYIFRAKNFYGMRDQIEQTITHVDQLGTQDSREAIEQRLSSVLQEDCEPITVDVCSDHNDAS